MTRLCDILIATGEPCLHHSFYYCSLQWSDTRYELQVPFLPVYTHTTKNGGFNFADPKRTEANEQIRFEFLSDWSPLKFCSMGSLNVFLSIIQEFSMQWFTICDTNPASLFCKEILINAVIKAIVLSLSRFWCSHHLWLLASEYI